MTRLTLTLLAVVGLSVVAVPTNADVRRCSAHYTFDGSLADASGNGYDLLLIDPSNAPTGGAGRYEAGKFGQALSLDGTEVAVAPLDLDYQDCPQVSIVAWVYYVEPPPAQQAIISTGFGHGPVVATTASRLSAWGGNHEIRAPSGSAPPTGVWTPVIATWDFGSGALEHALYWPDGSQKAAMQVPTRLPQQDFWIGGDAYQTQPLRRIASKVLIDDVRVYGRVLTTEEIAAAQAGNPPPVDGCGCGATALMARVGTAGNTSSFPAPVASTTSPMAPGVADVEGVPPPASPTARLGTAATQEEADPTLVSPDLEGPVVREPELTAPEDLPGDVLEEELATAQSADPDRAYFHCETPGTADVQVARRGSLPPNFLDALEQARSCRFPIDAVELTDRGEWVIVAGGQFAHSVGLREEIVAKLTEYNQAGRPVNLVEITPFGGWLIAAGGDVAHAGLPNDASTKLEAAARGTGGIASFATAPASPSNWVVIDKSGTVSGRNLPARLLQGMADLPVSKRQARTIEFAPDGAWAFFTDDLWFLTERLGSDVLQTLRSRRTRNRELSHLVFFGNQGNFALISNGLQAAGAATDPGRVESAFQVKDPSGSWVATVDNLWARMARHRITAVEIALVDENRIAWSRGYGLREVGDGESYVFTDTIFDAASVSKAMSAVGIMQLVERGQIDPVKEGVLLELEPMFSKGAGRNSEWQRFKDALRPEVSNLAQILQHCAGIGYEQQRTSPNLGGVFKYGVNYTRPTLPESILGEAPGVSTHKVLRLFNSGANRMYSGANYALVQGLIYVHTGSYLDHMSRLLSDLQMSKSSFQSPPAAYGTDRFARGHELNVMLPYKTYSELAPASLTSTSVDLAKFVIALNKGGSGVLRPDTVDALLGRTSIWDYVRARTPAAGRAGLMQGAEPLCYNKNPPVKGNEMNDMQLGINRVGSGDSETFWHNGDHVGYHAKMFGRPGRGQGAVVIITGESDDATRFYVELKRNIDALLSSL